MPDVRCLTEVHAAAVLTRSQIGRNWLSSGMSYAKIEHLPLWIFLSSCVCLLNGQNTTPVPPASPSGKSIHISSNVNPELYQLRPGDVIEVRLFYNPELNEQVQIRPDGEISMQLIGEVHLASRTIPQATDLLRSLYIKYVRTPEVTVQVKTFAAQKVYVVGEVVHPSVINLPGPMTVFAAINEAGGIKNTGSRNLAVLVQKGPNGTPEGRKLVLFDHGVLTPEASTLLGPFDVVMVPESKISRLDRWVDQTIRQMIPVMMTAGFNYFISQQAGGVPIL